MTVFQTKLGVSVLELLIMYYGELVRPSINCLPGAVVRESIEEAVGLVLEDGKPGFDE